LKLGSLFIVSGKKKKGLFIREWWRWCWILWRRGRKKMKKEKY